MTYAGNKLFNRHNMILVIALLPSFVVADAGYPLGAVCVFLLFFFVVASSAYFFELTTDTLTVKNYLLPFIVTNYSLKDITNIELTSTIRSFDTDAIVTVYCGDQKSKSFNVTCLGLKEWQSLVDDLRDKKISITISAKRLADKIGIRED